MRRGSFHLLQFAVCLLLDCGVGASSAVAQQTLSLRTVPERIELLSPEATDQLLVFRREGDAEFDVTRSVQYTISDPSVVTISAGGLIAPLKDGSTEVLVTSGETRLSVPVIVSGIADPVPVSFHQDVIPILSKAGCNAGGCHGKAEGQNGFKLSVFGFDAVGDFDAIVKEGRGRRVFPASPESSLLIAKATGRIPHGGGIKIERGSAWHRRLIRWMNEGLRLDEEAGDSVVEILVEPSEVVLPANGTQQLRVVARSASGRLRGITAEADFQSNHDVVAGVSRSGLIESNEVPGEAAVLVRYMGHVEVCRVTRPRPEGQFTRPAENTFVDRLVWDKLQRLNIAPSEPADDATFLRRVFLDTIGTLPTSAEAREFLGDSATDKRSRLIDRLLSRPEYADYWAQRWTDILQVDKDVVTPTGAVAMTRWVRGQLQQNVPYDQFVRSIITAEGSTLSESPAGFYKVQSDPEKAARAVSQLFLGVRIECAQCHHHPFEKWDRQDYYGWAGFFTGIDRRAAAGGATKIVSKEGEDLKHPRTGEPVPAMALGSSPADFKGQQDRRKVLAAWLTSKENPYFTRTIANRLFAHFFGRGLVEPLDDLRVTNPASNEPLLTALVDHMVEVNFDQKAFIRTLLNSQAYQLSSRTSESNSLDEQNYSHAFWKPVPAEVLLDAISQVTGVPEQFNGWPEGYRAIQIWDNKLPSHFLQVFGRPMRQTVCACERGSEPSIAQALHLMNSETTSAKLEHRHGLCAKLAASDLSEAEIVEEIYLTALSRLPTDSERSLMMEALSASDNRRKAIEDLMWTVLNLKEFVFNH